MGAIEFHPNFVEPAGPEGVNWLRQINKNLQEKEALEVDTAKDIFRSRNALDIPPGIKTAVTDILVAHYGLSTEFPSFFKEIEVQKDLTAAIGLETFHIDSALAVAEYNAGNWTESLSPYAMYVPNTGVRFHGFVNGCIASAVDKKSAGLAIDAAAEKERILHMTPDEWHKFNQGMMWSQSGRAKDKYRELMAVVEAIKASTKYIDGLAFLQSDKIESALKDVFGTLETTNTLDQHSTLAPITYADIALQGQISIILNNILQPVEQPT